MKIATTLAVMLCALGHWGCPASPAADGGSDAPVVLPADSGAAGVWTVVRPAQSGAPTLFGIYGLGADQFITVGQAGTILYAAPPAGAPDPSLSDTPPPLAFSPMALPAGLPTPFGQPPDIEAISGSGPTDVYAVTLGDTAQVDMTSTADMQVPRQGGVILHYDGTAWQRQQPQDAKGNVLPLSADLFGVYAYSGGAITVGETGTWLQRTTGAWQAPQSLPVESLSDVYGTSAKDVFAVGGNGSAYHFDGSNWSAASPDGFTGMLAGVFGQATAGGAVYAVGLSGTIFKRSGNQLVNYGGLVNPTCSDKIPSVFLRHGAITPGGQVIIAGWEGAILRLSQGRCGDAGMAVLAVNESGITQSRLEGVLAQRTQRKSGPRTTVYIVGADGLVLRGEWSEP